MSAKGLIYRRIFDYVIKYSINIKDRVFPPRCGGCGRPVKPGQLVEFCEQCLSILPWIVRPFCLKCGKDFNPSNAADAGRFSFRICASCRVKQPGFEAGRSAFRYEGVARQAVQSLKFRGRKTLAESFAILLEKRLVDEPIFLEGVDLVIPVPLHPSRRRERGFNQSALVAWELSKRLGIPFSEKALIRNRGTRPQVGLSAKERADNIRGAFQANEEVMGKVILLIDDVMATGATASACSRALRVAGATETRVLTLARD